MKKSLSSLIATTLLTLTTSIAAAQGGTSQVEKPTLRRVEPGFIAKGFKVGLTAASFDMKYKMKTDFFTYEEKSDERYGAGGLMLGYEHLRNNAIGFNTDLTLHKHSKKEGYELAILVASVNMNYGFTAPASLYGGLNISRVTQGLTYTDSTGKEVQPMGLGLQLGGGYNFTKSVQMTLGYHVLSQKAELRSGDNKVGEIETTQTSLVSALAFIF